ncbi:MAG: PAS domain S-box protein [Mobilitalea sp.]
MENRQIKILAIDDNQDNLIILKALIKESFPYVAVFTALNGPKGIELAALEDPDVILLDIVMPGMDGFEVCRELKADRELIEIPVVFVTANKGDKESRIIALECGAEAFLTKPVDKSELIAQIRAMLKIREANLLKRDENERLTALVEQKTYELKKAHSTAMNLLEDLKIENEVRKESQIALMISEEKYRRIAENISDVVWTSDLSLNATYVSPSIERLLYTSSKDYINSSIEQKFTSESINRMRSVLLGELEKENDSKSDKNRTRILEVEHYKADGTTVWVSIHVSFIRDIGTNIIGLQGVTRDISERKNAEKVLRSSELRYRRLFETAKDGIFILEGETGKVIDVNPFLLELLDCSKDQIMLMTAWEIGLFKHMIPTRDSFLELLQKGYTHYENISLTTSFGEQITVEFVSNIYFVDKQKVMQCNIRDITDRKKAENELRQTKEYLEKLISYANAPIVVWNEDFEITKFNGAFEILIGRTEEEVLGEEVGILFPPNKLVDTMSQIKNIRNGKSIQNTEIDIIHRDGSVRTVMWSLATIYDQMGIRNISTIAQGQDITERIAAEKELRYLSYHDQLTGAFNRRFFEEELKKMDKEENLPISIAIGDINGLKLINDSFGHSIGDELLKKAVEVMQKGCRQGDTVARLGGDEFVIILPKTDSMGAAEIISNMKNLASNIKVFNVELSISYGHDTKVIENQTISELLVNAENYLYRHKLYERSSMRSKIIDIVMNTLFEKSSRESLHSKRVSELCEAIAIKMNLDADDINQILIAGLLHDIGKIGVDEDILNKPGSLNEYERSEIEKHPETGWRILSSTNEFSELAQFILEHHEKWNGQGYPNGLKGDEISFVARIIAIADSFDAMTRDRSYRKGFSEEEAVNEIKRCAGTQFDPQIAKIFIEKVLDIKWN